jgi:hypothetical protein
VGDPSIRFLLNLIPILGQGLQQINFTYNVGEEEKSWSGYWTGTFPVNLHAYGISFARSVTIARNEDEQLYFAILDSDNEFISSPTITGATINGFIGWAWEVVPQVI